MTVHGKRHTQSLEPWGLSDVASGKHVHARSLRMHLTGELLGTCEISSAGPDAGQALRSGGLGYPLDFDLHLRNLPIVINWRERRGRYTMGVSTYLCKEV
jgi:hypothetical protein